MSEWKELNGIAEVADAVQKEMDIFCSYDGMVWGTWNGQSWHAITFYRARQKEPAMKMVKSLCWRCEEGGLLWGDLSNSTLYKRFPAGDIEGEVEE